MNLLKYIYLLVVSILPLPSKYRALFYKIVPGYKVEYGSKISFGTIIYCNEVVLTANSTIEPFVLILNVNKLILNEAIIKRFVFILNVNKVILNEKAVIGKFCKITAPKLNYQFTKSELNLGKTSTLTSGHLLDLCDSIIIGDNVVLAGRGSQLWTHYFDLNRNRVQAPIIIGNNIYIGSSVIIGAGIKICNEVVIAAGSCIFTDIEESGVWSTKSNLIKKGEVKDFSALGYTCIGQTGKVKYLRRN